MNNTRLKISQLLNRSPDDSSGKAQLLQKAGRLDNECGCLLAGVFLVLSSVIFAFYIASARNMNLPKICLLGICFIFFSAIAGKLLGIGIAKTRLFLMYKLLLHNGG
jgi:hypothetical protein